VTRRLGRSGTGRALCTAICCTLTLLLAAACSGKRHPSVATRFATDASAPLAATSPYLLMSDATTGLAVWPSEHAWLLLGTTDGWQHVANRTPIAVPTSGGLVADIFAGNVAVAIGAFERLTESPLVTSSSEKGPWRPSELPGAIADSRDAVSLAGRRTAILNGAGGTVVSYSAGRWRQLTTASTLAPGGGLRLDGVTSTDGALGWLTGHGRSGTPMAFQTVDRGHSWTPVPQAGQAVAALAPCGQGRNWVLPLVAANGTVRLDRTTDGGTSWRTGASVALGSGPPAWGCSANEVWLAGRADHVFVSNDAGASWVDAGRGPAGLTDLSPTGHGAGFAASETTGAATLWAVAGNGRRFTKLALPAWVATVGAQMGTS
jgi:hypothetical protein